MCDLVNIFIPTFNAIDCIEETLNSVLSQTYQNLEVWIVDDASTDGTQEVLKAWESKDSRLHLILKDVNGGNVPLVWNIVLPHLHGEWTLYMSHDDLLSNDCIELLAEKGKDDVECVIPTCVGFESNPLKPEAHLREFNRRSDVSERKPVITGRKAFDLMLNYDIPGFALWKTSLIQKMGMPTKSFNSDECMQRLWALNCRQVAFCPKAKFYYHLSPNSIVKGLKPYHYGSLLTQRRLLKAIMQKGVISANAFRFLYKWMRSEIYLRRQFSKMRNQYTQDERTAISKILYPWK